MNEWEKNRRMAESYRQSYPPGTRLELIGMDDPFAPVPAGMRGTVNYVDDQSQIHVKWDNGSGLALIPDMDSFRRLSAKEIEAENAAKGSVVSRLTASKTQPGKEREEGRRQAKPNKKKEDKEVREITMYDELELDLVGDRKTALFFIISDTDATFNFLVSMAYTQLFNLLCERADDKFGGRLPVHVRCLIDEAANIGQIPNLEKLMATIRSREISACLVLQAQSQLKALYKDNMDTIIGNCDSSLFLGGKEETTLKSWNSLLGKETIDMYNTSVTKGTQESHGQNFQKLGKDLMSMDELAVMDGGKCLLQVRGVRPFLSRKYDITKHPNYKYLSDFNPKNTFDIEKYLSTRLRVRPDDLFLNYEISPSELAEESADDTG